MRSQIAYIRILNQLFVELDFEKAFLMVVIHLGYILGMAICCFFIGILLRGLVFLLSFLWVHLLGFIMRV
jgi:hypothetical protein